MTGGAGSAGGTGALRGASRAAVIAVIAVIEVCLCVSLLGPQLLGWLWVGSQVNFETGSLGTGLMVAFVGTVVTMVITVWLARRLESVWEALRPETAQRGKGQLGFFEQALVIGTAIAVVGFTLWFLVFAGPDPSISPRLQ